MDFIRLIVENILQSRHGDSGLVYVGSQPRSQIDFDLSSQTKAKNINIFENQ